MLFSSSGARQAAAGALVMAFACGASTFASGTALAAPAPSPATVTVRVEGLNETKVPPTQVTTTDTTVIEPAEPTEHACPGTSALGALQLATGGDWSGPWSSEYSQYEVFSIEGEDLPFESSSEANYYWDFWLNDKESHVGACEAELEHGDEVLFFPGCFGGKCPPEPTPLGIEAPEIADVAEPVNVIVKQYNNEGEPAPAVGATVTGGAVPATTNSQGHATVTFASAGSFLLHVTGSPTGPASVRTEARLCVHNGNDGTCGTKAPGIVVSSPIPVPQLPVTAPYVGPYAVVADVTGLMEHHHYHGGSAPRLLTGTVTAPTAIKNVRVRLTRTASGADGAQHCSYYDGSDDRFHAMPCGAGHGQFFAVGDSAKFSYLLPAPLPRGRYVMDVEASDLAGSTSKLARGSSRVVFYVE